MYIVIAGQDEVALRIAEQLMTEHNVTVITLEPAETSRLDRLDIEVVSGAATALATLRAASVHEADHFIAGQEDDEKNIVACIAAQRLGAKHTTCFLTRRGFFSVESNDIELAASLGIDSIVRPAENLANEIVNIVTVPGALDHRSFANGRVHLLKFEVTADSPLTNGPLSRIKLPPGVLIIMGQRGDEYFIPKGDTEFQADDRATAMGTRRGIRLLTRFLFRRRRKTRRVTVVGGGVVGVAVAEKLTESGWKVKLIEVSPARCQEIAGNLDCMVLCGDGTDLALLEEERVAEDDALVAVTNNDEGNLLVSLLAKHLGVRRIITRADKLINEQIFEKVGIDVVLSAKGAAIRWVVQDVVAEEAVDLAELEHGHFHVLEIELPEDFPDVTLKELRPPVIVGAILRSRRALVPRGRERLKRGDHLIVFCKSSQIQNSRDFFCKAGERFLAADQAS